MSWTIERRGRVAVVTMNTNPVNAQNRAFFADLHEAFDSLETDHPNSPVVLTGTGTRFSAGLDLGEHFPLFAGGRGGRVLVCRLPRHQHAAVHLPATHRGGGERPRVCRGSHHRGGVRPPPRRGRRRRGSASTRSRSGSRCRRSTCGCSPMRGANRSRPEPACSGTSSPPRSPRAGHVPRPRPRLEALLDRAVAIAEQTPEDCLDQYAFTKRACQAAALRDIADLADPLERPNCPTR